MIKNCKFQFSTVFIIIIILILLILLVICSTNSEHNFEHYDEKIIKTPPEKCGIICTKVLGCSGFASNKENNICYLSKNALLGRPQESIFSPEYNKYGYRCNKIFSIEDPVIANSYDISKNATYKCQQGETGKSEIKIYDNQERNLNNLNELVNTTISPYTFEEVDWGREISLDDHKYLSINPTPSNTVEIFEKKDDDYLGTYLYPHKCVANIPEKQCLKACIDNPNCSGTEWNPLYLENKGNQNYITYPNVCCPKTNIFDITKRNDNNKYGKFYKKTKIYSDQIKNQDYIYVA